MWLATQHGFYSIVKKDENVYHVRARIHKDLENLLLLVGKEHKILKWEGADYRYRIIVSKSEFAEIMAKLALAIDYGNFKNEIARHDDQREKLHAFHEIWAILAKLQK